MEKFSIVIPIYNTAKYLSKCIESVLNQTYKNIEIILVNDGSPDNAEEICQKYFYDERVKYIKKENEGVAIARNTGIKNATGKYIFCLDSDDRLEIDFIKKTAETFENKGCDFVIIRNSNMQVEKSNITGCLTTWGFAVSSEMLNKYPDVRFIERMQPCEDGLFSHKLLALTDKIEVVHAEYLYTARANSIEHTINTGKILNDIPKWFEILEDFYNKYNLWDSKKLHLLAFIYREPFDIRFKRLPMNEKEREHLFNLIHDFIKKHQILNKEFLELFPEDFQNFLKCKNYKQYYKKYCKKPCKKVKTPDIEKLSLLQKIFSIKNSKDAIHKNITILGIKIKLKRKLFELPKETNPDTNNRILILCNESLVLHTGGVAHVLSNMANEFSKRGYEICVGTMENKIGEPFYPLDKNVSFYNIYSDKIFERSDFTDAEEFVKYSCEMKANRWNKFIEKINPNLIICFSLPTLLEISYKQNIKVPVILTVHGRPINDYTDRFWSRPVFMNELFKNAYNSASTIQVLLDSYRDTIPEEFKGRVCTIANIAPYNDFTINYDKTGKKKIVCIASFDERKHQDLLINAFSLIAEKYPDWTLELWGNGEKGADYQNLIIEKDMLEHICIKGVTTSSKDVLKNTDIFALPSTCEGWPLVLGEAMSMGIPCIGLEECDGTNEIIRNDENGFLCKNDETDIANALEKLILSVDLRKKFGLQAQQDMKNYTSDIIWDKWEQEIKLYL